MSALPAAIDHRFRQPAHAGCANGERILRGVAESAGEGARVVLELGVTGAMIVQARFQALACPFTIAAADWLCERLEGQPLQAVAPSVWAGMEPALELPPQRRHCQLLLEDALRAALSADGAQLSGTAGTPAASHD